MQPLPPNDPQLRLPSQPVSRRELKTKAFQMRLEQLLEVVYGQNNKGSNRHKSRPSTVGLSAPQVGWPRRVSVVDMAIGTKNYHDIHVLINPEITRRSPSDTEHIEGCVNLRGVWGPVRRPRLVTLRALDRSGNQLTFRLSGWAAVLAQHEVDHLDGVLFIDRLEDASRAHLVEDQNFKKFNKKSAADWPYRTDVSQLTRPIKVAV